MIRIFQLLFALLVSVPRLTAGEPRTLTCDFDGENATRVYKVVTAIGVGTTFRLPEGLKIDDFVVTDPKGFHAESNGTIGIVTPLVPNKSTSVSIFTDNEKLFVFYLSSEPSESVDQLVIIQSSNLQFFKDKVRSEAQKLVKERVEAGQAQLQSALDQNAKQVKEQMLFSLNSNYDIKDERFKITKVSDDGIFTYIHLAKSQDRPVVYLGEKNDPKKLEPVKFTDEGEYYTVHRVVTQGERKHFFLKLGNEVSEIRAR
jgi:type IV secretory pathway VirB9-like protein